MMAIQRFLGEGEKLVIERHAPELYGFCAYITQSAWEEAGHGHTIENAIADLDCMLQTRRFTTAKRTDFERDQPLC
jgi:hypothetical protein